MSSTVTSTPASTVTPDTQFLGPDVQIGTATSVLGFYGTAPIAKQSSSGVSTVAGVVALLQALGLVS